MSSLTELAEEALANAKRLDAYAAANGLPQPSLDVATLESLPSDLEDCRKSFVDVSQVMKQIGNGPIGQFYDILFNFTDSLSLEFIYHHNLAQYVPDKGEISFEDLASASGVTERLVRRFLQHAMSNHLFQETHPGQVSHTAASLLLKTNSGMRDTVGFLLHDIRPASTCVIKAMQTWPESAEPNETGFNLAENTTDSFYQHLAKDPERSRRFGAGMRFMTKGSLYDLNHLIQGYDWQKYDRPGACLVDVGGGHGGVSLRLAEATCYLRFIVQDLPATVEEGIRALPKSSDGRVEFMPHDFFKEQPVTGADIYFFRFILHNWADKYAIKILRNLIPAMRDGSKIVIYEFMPEEKASTAWSQKQKRNLDMIQATGWNSLERTEQDWAKLFPMIDERLVFLGARTMEGGIISLIEAEFRAVSR